MEAKNIEVKNLKKIRTVPDGRLAKSAAGVRGQSMADQAGGVVQRVTSYVEENPFAAVTLAFGVGILASFMLRAAGINLAQLLTPAPMPEDDATD